MTAGWPLSGTLFPGAGGVWDVTVGDIDGDAKPEVLFTDNAGSVRAFHADGSAVAGFPIVLPLGSATEIALGDVDGDGLVELVVIAAESRDTTFVYVFDRNADWSSASAPWPQSRHDAQRSASFQRHGG